MKKLYSLIASLLLINASFAGNTAEDFISRFQEANKLMEEKFWNQSITIWQELITADNTNGNVNYKLGYCYLQTSTEKAKALEFLKNSAAMPMTKNYDPYDPNERKPPVDVLYYLGRAYALNYELDNAITTYNDLIKKAGKKHHLSEDAKHQIEMCEEAKRQLANPKNFVITNVGPVINQETNDFSPVLSIDESAMFFTSKRLRADTSNSGNTDYDTGEFREDIYVSYKDQEGNWMTPELLNINIDSDDATIGVSPDGQTLFIYRGVDGNGQIYESALVGETWSEPTLLGSDINTEEWETHATISADGGTLYFVSNRPGGYGGRDIYKCVKLPNGEWSRALNVGTNLNTPWEEDSPFLTPDGETLYFSSSGHNSMGGFDIFYSTLGADGEWSTPVNMGYPLNTVDDDVFFVPMADGRHAFFASGRQGGYGRKDIYQVDLPEVTNECNLALLKGFIIAEEGKELPNDLRVLMTNNKTSEVTEYRPRKRDGGYVAILQPCNAYHLEYIKAKEIFHEDFVQVPCEASYCEIEREVYLTPVSITGGAAVIVPEVKPEPKTDTPVAETKPALVDKPADHTFDAANPIVVSMVDGVSKFSRYFPGDFTDFGKEESKFQEFITDVKSVIDYKGSAVITVESSASKIPSSKFKNNQELSAFRNKSATKQVKDALENLGYKEGKDFTFGKAVELVQGKDYENDAVKNKRIYEQYQYIKIEAK